MDSSRLKRILYLPLAKLILIHFIFLCSLYGEYPSKPITVIVPFAAGGGSDVFVHVSAFKDAKITKIDQGQAMEYVIAEHKGKPVATQLKVIGEATAEETPAESSTESA